MEFRYLGFSHQGNARVYRFDVIAKGEINRHLTISADISLFLAHHVGIQEGPTLCAQKLAADLEATLETTGETDHQLTADDLQRYAAARTLALESARTASGIEASLLTSITSARASLSSSSAMRDSFASWSSSAE